MKRQIFLLIVLAMIAACDRTNGRASYVSLDECDLFIPDGYFVNSGSIRHAGVRMVAGRSSGETGSIGIEYGVEDIPTEYEQDQLRIRVIREQQVGQNRYFLLGVTLGEDRPEQEVIRAEIGSYTLSIAGHAKEIWKQHLVCRER